MGGVMLNRENICASLKAIHDFLEDMSILV